jgi:hypothetical protein
MNAHYPNLDMKAANDILLSSRLAGTKRMLGSGNAFAVGAAGWLSLAAAPTFAIMALLTGVLGGPLDMLCSAAQEASPLTGMASMYLLMSAFHSAPWLKLISSRRITSIHHAQREER